MFTLSVIAILSLIVDPTIRVKVQKVWNAAPTYFFWDAASSSGKYHPFFDLGDHGVYRHSLLVALFAHEGASAQAIFTQRDVDCITAAGLLHDLIKRGVDGGDHTVFEHPLLAAKFIRDMFEGDEDMEYIASLVEPHMGKWCTSKYSDAVLPTPKTHAEMAVSFADMIASREILGRLHKPETWAEEVRWEAE